MSFREAVEYLYALSERMKQEHEKGSAGYEKVSALLTEFFILTAQGGKKLTGEAHLITPNDIIREDAYQKLVEISKYISENISELEPTKNQFN